MTTNTALAGGFQLFELATPIMGTAGAGQAAVADDASTAFFNPAGMTLLDRTQIFVGTQLIKTTAKFKASENNETPGTNGGDAGVILPGISGFFVYSYSPDLKFGLSVTSPFAGEMDYGKGWVGRFIAQDVEILTINVNPVAAYRLNDWFSLGGGLSVQYAQFKQGLAVELPGSQEGSIDVDVDDFNVGFNVGFMFHPWQTTRFGLSYRSEIKHKLSGNVDLQRIAVQPSVTTILKTPHSIIISAYHDITPELTLLADLGWTNWKSLKSSILQIGGNATLNIPRGWKDTWRIGGGVRYKTSEKTTIMTGISYDSSPVSNSRRTPDLPFDRQIRIGAGLLVDITEDIRLGVAYEYTDAGKAKIDRAGIAGDYSTNNINAFTLSINVKI